MNLQEYIRALKACLASHPLGLGDADSILGLLYEAHSESNAMYDDEIKAELERKLSEFKEGMKEGSFPLADPTADDSPCKYCKYAAICGLM